VLRENARHPTLELFPLVLLLLLLLVLHAAAAAATAGIASVANVATTNTGTDTNTGTNTNTNTDNSTAAAAATAAISMEPALVYQRSPTSLLGFSFRCSGFSGELFSLMGHIFGYSRLVIAFQYK
jgi:hypothetical protein